MVTKIFNNITGVFAFLITLVLIGTGVVAIGVFYLVLQYSRDLPDYSQLAQYSPPVVTRLYAADGHLIDEYAKEKRIFVPIHAIPKKVINAFVAAEDKNFYTHPGIDLPSIFRAGAQNLVNLGKHKSLVGGSTITQQVVKNFLLTNEKSFNRKIKEAILSFRISQAYSKDKIMELYLNQIYLGNHSYGIAAAALNYFNKSLDELTVEESATLASLPKAPSTLDPRRYPEKNKERRDWVISRMEEDGYISEVDAVLATSKPVTVSDQEDPEIVSNAAFFSETVRQKLESLYGEEGVYEKGLEVRTTVDPILQGYAEKALHNGLIAYDRRHGYRGPIKHIEDIKDWKTELNKINPSKSLEQWQLAVVIDLTAAHAVIGLADGSTGKISLENMSWAKKYINDNSIGGAIRKPSDVFAKGDVVAVSKKTEGKTTTYSLEQVPEANGGIVAMEPYTGKVLALVGGYHYGDSQFNRAVQAKRQPGSAFKPFVYLKALENGFAPNSIIIDDEIQLDGGNNTDWRPKNYSGQYYGPSTLRIGVEKSRNAMTVRLSQLLGIDKIVEVSKRFGISQNPVENFSTALGANETTLLDLTNAYSMLANGGKMVTPSLIERIQDRNGQTIYKMDNRKCDKCDVVIKDNEVINNPEPPTLEDKREVIADPLAVYQITSIMEGVIQRGTGHSAAELGRTIAGKTGTTNDSFDTWFMGFSSNLVVGVYVGFDTPRSLGKRETGAAVSLPIWKEFMTNALANKPDVPFRRPAGIKLVKIDAKTGLLPSSLTPRNRIIFEAFRDGQEPTSSSEETFLPSTPSNEGGDEGKETVPDLGSGGIY